MFPRAIVRDEFADLNSRPMPLPEKMPALAAIAALALTGGLACAWELALIWDGGAQFCYTLFHGRGYAYAARFFSAIVWEPVIWAAHFTDNLAVLHVLHGLPLCLAPAASAALSWWMVARSRPALFRWALMGICVASAPVQVFAINESIFQFNVFWPVFVGLLVPLNIARWFVIAALLVFQLSHPQGLLLLAGGICIAIAAWTRSERRVIPLEGFAWTRGGPAEHWGLGPQVIAKLGGRKLVLGETARAALRENPPRVEIGYDAWVSPEPGVLGWFDFRETVR